MLEGGDHATYPVLGEGWRPSWAEGSRCTQRVEGVRGEGTRRLLGATECLLCVVRLRGRNTAISDGGAEGRRRSVAESERAGLRSIRLASPGTAAAAAAAAQSRKLESNVPGLQIAVTTICGHTDLHHSQTSLRCMISGVLE